jgi:hypothetical protein
MILVAVVMTSLLVLHRTDGSSDSYAGPLQTVGVAADGVQFVGSGTEVDFSVQMSNKGHAALTLRTARLLNLPHLGAPAQLVNVGVLRSTDPFSGLRGWPPKLYTSTPSLPLMGFVIPAQSNGAADDLYSLDLGVRLAQGETDAAFGGLVVTYTVDGKTKQSGSPER